MESHDDPFDELGVRPCGSDPKRAKLEPLSSLFAFPEAEWSEAIRDLALLMGVKTPDLHAPTLLPCRAIRDFGEDTSVDRTNAVGTFVRGRS